MYLSRSSRLALRAFTVFVVAVLYFPLAYVARLSFSTAKSFAWPGRGFTTEWWADTFRADGPRQALGHSLWTAALATLIALFLGSAASFALTRFAFFGRQSLNLVIALPIALPGIITGIALRSAFERVGIDLSLLTLVVAHATFCIVIVFNNVAARLRRLAPSLGEASADLGADPIQTFRLVTFPLILSALVAGALLAFALSFDEIIVTTFTAESGYQTLPIWIFQNMFRPNNLPQVNVTATFVVVASIVPVYVAQKLSDRDWSR